jgi:hypothetical protein
MPMVTKINKKYPGLVNKQPINRENNIPWTMLSPELSQLETELAGSWKLALRPPTTERPAYAIKCSH